MRRDHNSDSCALFADLLKSHDSVKYEVIPVSLKKMGATPKCIRWIQKLHGDFNVGLKVGHEEREIEHGRGTRHGDNFAPNSFVLVVYRASEEIKNSLK